MATSVRRTENQRFGEVYLKSRCIAKVVEAIYHDFSLLLRSFPKEHEIVCEEKVGDASATRCNTNRLLKAIIHLPLDNIG